MTGWKLKTGEKKSATNSLRNTKIDSTRIKKLRSLKDIIKSERTSHRINEFEKMGKKLEQSLHMRGNPDGQ